MAGSQKKAEGEVLDGRPIRISQATKESWERAAAADAVPLSEYIRQRVNYWVSTPGGIACIKDSLAAERAEAAAARKNHNVWVSRTAAESLHWEDCAMGFGMNDFIRHCVDQWLKVAPLEPGDAPGC